MSHRVSIGLVVLIIGGCGSSSDTSSTPDADVLTISGSGCSISSTSIDTSTLVTETDTMNLGLAECPEDLDGDIPGPGSSNTGAGSLTSDGWELSVNTAIYELLFTGNSRSTSQLILHDGEYRSLSRAVTNGTDTATRVDWGIYNATVLLDMELVQNGEEGFTGGSFEFMSDNPDTGTNNLSDVILFIDRDGDKKPSATEEVSEVISGNVNVSGVATAWMVTLDLTLEDGSTLTGNYSGSFHSALSQ